MVTVTNIGLFSTSHVIPRMGLGVVFMGWVGCDTYIDILLLKGILPIRFLTFLVDNVVYVFIVVFMCSLYFFVPLYCTLCVCVRVCVRLRSHYPRFLLLYLLYGLFP